MENKYFLILFLFCCQACTNNQVDFDATGSFEADDIIVSAEASGRIMHMDIREGDKLQAQEKIGYIDTTQLHLKHKQLLYTIAATRDRIPNISDRLSAINEQLKAAQYEKKRIENLQKGKAATHKQLDDISAQIDILKGQQEALSSSLVTTKQSLHSEIQAWHAQLEQIEDYIKKSILINPVTGTVLTQYAKEGEVVRPGKALYKIASLERLTLTAYVSGSQLPQIQLGQEVTIFIDQDENQYKTYKGRIISIADEAEFTPKTIQTKEERVNLVYAIKVDVKNDGYLKIGMYGEVKFDTSKDQ